MQFLGAGQKACLDGHDDGTAAGMLEGGGDGCSFASLQHSKCCTAKHQRQDCSLPSFQQTHSCTTGIAGLQGQGSAALGASQAGSSVLAFHVLMAAYLVGGSASQGREAEELLWITDPLGICSFSVAAFSVVRSWSNASTHSRVTGVLEQQVWCSGNKWFECFPICCCSRALSPLCRQKWDWFSLHL